VLIAVAGVPLTFAIAAGLQFLATLTTTRLRLETIPTTTQRMKMLESLGVGIRVVLQSPPLIAIIVLALAPTVLVMPYINLMPVFARDELGLGSTGLGIMLASTGLGTVAGALHVARSPQLRDLPNMQVFTAAGFAICVLAFALTPWVPLAIVLLFVSGWMSAAFLAINQTSLQLLVDDHVRGRVMSIYLLTWGMLPLGQLAVGALADVVGTPLAMTISCLVSLGFVFIIRQRFRPH
jgi:predicted MFS family arabinose efflux permease